MNLDQLEAFIDYVAICGAAEKAPDKSFQCAAATIRFQVKNSQAQALLRVVQALDRPTARPNERRASGGSADFVPCARPWRAEPRFHRAHGTQQASAKPAYSYHSNTKPTRSERH